jgi:Cd2+/Zn2+-exporting ATPase
MAAIAESFSTHPIAKAIVEAHKEEVEQGQDYHEYAGLGVEVQYKEKNIKVGKRKYVDPNKLYQENENNEGTSVYVSVNNECIGVIVIGDETKDEAKEAISLLKSYNINTGIVSGDNNRIVNTIGDQVGIDMVFGERLPLQKVEKIEELQQDGPVAFVGDGINDAPALLKSSVGIAMGTLGSEAAIESGDVILMNDNLNSLCDAIKISKKTVRIAKQNLVFIVLFKLISMVLGALGILPMWGAVIADVGVCLLSILNSLRVRL